MCVKQNIILDSLKHFDLTLCTALDGIWNKVHIIYYIVATDKTYLTT